MPDQAESRFFHVKVSASKVTSLTLSSWIWFGLVFNLIVSLSVYAQDEPAAFQFSAKWIADNPDNGSPTSSHPLPILRHEFVLNRKVRRATLRVSGLGQFEAHINGNKVTDAVLTPGWTDYQKRIFYDSYDVTSKLRRGANAIGVMLGNGMYNVEETAGRYTKFNRSFGRPKLILQLDIDFDDGSQQMIASDDQWKTNTGPITFSSIYGGEDYDARLEMHGWDRPGYRVTGWSAATLVDGPGGLLTPETIPPVKQLERHGPVHVSHPGSGISVYDLGVNFAGWPEITVSGPAGASVTMIPGELLNQKGRVTQKSANASPDSRNSFQYVLRGGGRESWKPRFSYTGFRYVEVRSSDRSVKVLRLNGRALHDAVRVTGRFTSSDALFNRIHLLIDRAMLSNMFSVLTDCPHREKLGWLEQTHLAGSSLMYNYDLKALYAKMADDMQDAQLPNGMVPDIAPEFPVFEGAFRDSPEWGAAVVLSPWTSYQFYGDPMPLRDHYESMRQYIAYLHGRLRDGLLLYGLGDWYDVGPYEPGESKLTTKGLTATAIYFQMLTTISRIASILGQTEDASRYLAESEVVKKTFNQRFFNAGSGQYDRGSQTANAMPLAIGLVPEDLHKVVLANLVRDIRDHNNHVTAGDIGFHYVVRALMNEHRSDVLYDMLSQTDKPSYGDQLARGATTLTEAWDANPNSSQDHFMLGHAEEWFYRGLAGIDFDLSRDADSRITIKPAIVGEVRDVQASFQSKLGLIESGWKRSGHTVEMKVRIPSRGNATVILPADRPERVRINGRPLAVGGVVHSLRGQDRAIVCVVAGGRYHFRVELSQ